MNNQNIVCSVTFTDKKKVDFVRKHIPQDFIITNLAEQFKCLSDYTRLKIILALAKKELCVCEISLLLEVSVSAISHQLRLLKNLKLVKFRKDKKMVYYSLDDQHISKIINEALKHQNE